MQLFSIRKVLQMLAFEVAIFILCYFYPRGIFFCFLLWILLPWPWKRGGWWLLSRMGLGRDFEAWNLYLLFSAPSVKHLLKKIRLPKFWKSSEYNLYHVRRPRQALAKSPGQAFCGSNNWFTFLMAGHSTIDPFEAWNSNTDNYFQNDRQTMPNKLLSEIPNIGRRLREILGSGYELLFRTSRLQPQRSGTWSQKTRVQTCLVSGLLIGFRQRRSDSGKNGSTRWRSPHAKSGRTSPRSSILSSAMIWAPYIRQRSSAAGIHRDRWRCFTWLRGVKNAFQSTARSIKPFGNNSIEVSFSTDHWKDPPGKLGQTNRSIFG